MSNPNTPFGLQPSRRLDGAALNFMTNKQIIAYNNSNTIGEGDMVILNSSGVIDIASTTSNPVLGVFAGCSYADPSAMIPLSPHRAWTAPTLASSTVVTATVWDDPQLVFRIRTNGTLSQTAVGLNAKFGSNGSPNSITGVSTAFLDTTTVSTNSTYPLRIVGFAPDANNDTSSAYAVMEVVLNTSVYKTGTGV